MPEETRSNKPEVQWIPMGIVFGTAVGSVIKDMGVGLGIGLVLGSTVALFVERREKKRVSPLMLIVAVIAFVVIVSVTLLDRK